MLVKFIIHDKFKERINKIDSPITKAFLELKVIDDTKENYRNYISISFDNKALVSFLDKRKEDLLGENLIVLEQNSLKVGDEVYIDKKAYRGYFSKEHNQIIYEHCMVPYYFLGTHIKTKITSRYYDYSSFKTGSILFKDKWLNKTYLHPVNPAYTEKEVVKEVWNPDKRLKSKISKLINTLFPSKFTEREVEQFTLEYQKQGLMECGLDNAYYKIYSGESIKDAYLYKNYYNNKGGELHGSCMKHESCQDYFNIYIENSEQIELLGLITSDEKIRARCILWYPEGKSNKEAKKYYDRIYFDSTEDRTYMELWLESKGYIDVFNDKDWKNVSFTLDSGFRSDWKYPYMDSFKHLHTSGLISTHEEGNYCLENTDGYLEECEEECDYCGSNGELHRIYRGSRRDENLCEDCCTYCENIDEYVHNNDATYSEYYGYSFYGTSVYSSYHNSELLLSETTELYNGDYVDESLGYITCIDGTNFLDGDSNFIEINKEYYNINSYNIIYDNYDNPQLEEDCVEIEGVYYLKDSDLIENIKDEYKLKENVEL